LESRFSWNSEATREKSAFSSLEYYCQLQEMEKAKLYLKKAFEIDLNWRMAALEDEDLKPLRDDLETER
jgi:hypothetical protein